MKGAACRFTVLVSRNQLPVQVFFCHAPLLFDHYLPWHHCLLFLEHFSCAVPLQLEGPDPHGVPQHGTTLSFVVKALGSVKHEGPTTGKRQVGVICQALNTVFTSSCHAYDVSMCSELPRHHCLWPPHGVEDCTFFFPPLSCALGCILATFSSIFPVFLAWHCVLLAPVMWCHREIFTVLEAGTCAGSRAWKLSTSTFLLWFCFVSLFSLVGIALH